MSERPGRSPRVESNADVRASNAAVEAIRELAKMEQWSTQNSREAEKEFRAMTNQQLDAALLGIFGDALGVDFSEIVEADVVEDDVEELPALGAGAEDEDE